MKLTADDILQVAIEMERLGQTFYESLALGCGNERIEALATALAEAEMEHIRTFEGMREALPPQQRGPNLTKVELIAAAAELRKRIIPSAKAVLEVVQTSDISKALDMAIQMETEAVAFYAGLASDITSLDHDVLAGIAKEEESHLRMLRETRLLIAVGVQ